MRITPEMAETMELSVMHKYGIAIEIDSTYVVVEKQHQSIYADMWGNKDITSIDVDKREWFWLMMDKETKLPLAGKYVCTELYLTPKCTYTADYIYPVELLEAF